MSNTPEVKATTTAQKPKPTKAQIKEVMRVVSEGIGAIRKGTYQCHDCVAIVELQGFLANFKRDLEAEYDKLPESAPMAEFARPTTQEPVGAAK